MEDFKVNELRIKQLILLDSLVMLKLKNVLKDGDHLLDIVNFLLEKDGEDFVRLAQYANGVSYMNTEEWGTFLESLLYEKDGDVYDHSRLKEEFKDFLSTIHNLSNKK